jgi:LacI family transcriptional regulator
MSGILSENKIAAPFRLELIARPQTEQQTDDDDTVEQLVNCARINGIVTLPRVREAQMKRLSNMGIPVAVIAHTDYPLPPGVISVDTGPTSAIECQAMHAREIGAKRVGIITDQLMVAPTNLALVHEAMRKFKVPIIPDAFERAEFGTNDARAATLRLLKHFPDLDTLLAIDDLTAMGCLHACYQLGLKVPEQIRIIGIGNMFGEHSHCGLTTVDSHIGRQGQLAARAIMRCLAGERIEPRTLIEPTLLRRETTRLQF